MECNDITVLTEFDPPPKNFWVNSWVGGFIRTFKEEKQRRLTYVAFQAP